MSCCWSISSAGMAPSETMKMPRFASSALTKSLTSSVTAWGLMNTKAEWVLQAWMSSKSARRFSKPSTYSTGTAGGAGSAARGATSAGAGAAACGAGTADITFTVGAAICTCCTCCTCCGCCSWTVRGCGENCMNVCGSAPRAIGMDIAEPGIVVPGAGIVRTVVGCAATKLGRKGIGGAPYVSTFGAAPPTTIGAAPAILGAATKEGPAGPGAIMKVVPGAVAIR
mmetsp:Transcript_122728/g.354747  ORF Transcript_122728/g.354747 Transcript_122728/m.354747 type:complete len:226 (-) Transcript_122728:150-827(-)